jgi:integrase
LQCRDVQSDRLSMPSSRKGRGRREVTRKPIPIPSSLAARLADIAKGRPLDAPLLMTPSGQPWRTSNHHKPFQAAVKAAGLDPKVTFYAFRHTHITNMLLRNVPLTLVADACDTSPAMIKKTYASSIADHGETLLRAHLLDLAEPPAANVVSITRPKAG